MRLKDQVVLITGGAGFGWASPTFLGLAASSVVYIVLGVF